MGGRLLGWGSPPGTRLSSGGSEGRLQAWQAAARAEAPCAGQEREGSRSPEGWGGGWSRLPKRHAAFHPPHLWSFLAP